MSAMCHPLSCAGSMNEDALWLYHLLGRHAACPRPGWTLGVGGVITEVFGLGRREMTSRTRGRDTSPQARLQMSPCCVWWTPEPLQPPRAPHSPGQSNPGPIPARCPGSSCPSVMKVKRRGPLGDRLPAAKSQCHRKQRHSGLLHAVHADRGRSFREGLRPQRSHPLPAGALPAGRGLCVVQASREDGCCLWVSLAGDAKHPGEPDTPQSSPWPHFREQTTRMFTQRQLSAGKAGFRVSALLQD